MKRFLFQVIFSVCVAGCLVETGCMAVAKLADDAILAVLDPILPETPDPTPPAPAIPPTKAKPPVVDDEPLVPESVPTWMAALGILLAGVLPSKGVAPLGKLIGNRLLKVLGVKVK